MIPFNPFGKPLGELHTSDLAVLRTVREGWYAEYKAQVPDVKSIAKSLSAFANQWGGWLVYGVAEGGLEGNSAGRFSGIAVDELPLALERITRAAASHVSPPPLFETHVLHGPCEETGLEEGHAIVLLEVPSGGHTPYVHSSGVIYRRVADSSEPVRETDRTALDLLWERSRRREERLARLLDREMEVSRGEEDTPLLRLFLLCDPWGDRHHRATLSFEEYAEILGTPSTEEGHVVFDNLFPSAEGYIGRQVNGKNPADLKLTYEYRLDGASIVTIPLRTFYADQALALALGRAYHHAEVFQQAIPDVDGRALRIVDANLVLYLVGALLRLHVRLAEASGIREPFFAAARLSGLWRTTPFLDTPEYLDHLQRYGVPVIQANAAVVPFHPGGGPALIELREAHRPGLPAAMVAGLPLWREVFYALGIAPSVFTTGMPSLIHAAQRGSLAHRG